MLVVGVALAYVLAFVGHGLDLTDESFHLNWIRNPWLYPASVTQYGFLYHPLYVLAGGDIALLRGVNLVATIALASGLGFVLSRPVLGEGEPNGAAVALAAALPFGFVSTLLYSYWIITPSYNGLNLQGLLVSAIALSVIARLPAGTSRAAIAGHAALGVGGWMVFMAKPPSAAMLAVAALAFLLATRRVRLLELAVAAGVAALLLLATAVLIDGSVGGFVQRLVDGVALSSALDPRYSAGSMFRLSGVPLTDGEAWVFWALTAGTASAILLAQARSRPAQAAAAMLAVLAVGFGLQWLVGPRLFMPTDWSWSSLLVLAFPFGMAVALLVLAVRGQLQRPGAHHLAWAALLFALPYVYAFGSNVDYWRQAGNVGLFWLAAALVLVQAVYRGPGVPRVILTGAVLPFAFTTALVGFGMEHPYRQTQPIRLNDQPVAVAGGTLRLSPDFADYAIALRASVAEEAAGPGLPLIDLTGHYPGAAVLLDAISVGQPWMIGGYPGSATVAASVLDGVPCDVLARSWLLTEPGGPRAIPESIVPDLGPYESVGQLEAPTGSYPTAYAQVLLRPAEEAGSVLARCEEGRAAITKP